MAQFLKFEVINGNSVAAGGDYTRDVLIGVDDIENVQDVMEGGSPPIISMAFSAGSGFTVGTFTTSSPKSAGTGMAGTIDTVDGSGGILTLTVTNNGTGYVIGDFIEILQPGVEENGAGFIDSLATQSAPSTVITLKGSSAGDSTEMLSKVLTLTASTSVSSDVAPAPPTVSQNTLSQSITRAMSANPSGVPVTCQLGLDGDGIRGTSNQMYWSSAVFSVVQSPSGGGGSNYPTFTTDLDTEIQVGTVSEGGVTKDLFYKRYVINAISGQTTVSLNITQLNIKKSNVLIGTAINTASEELYNIFPTSPDAYTNIRPDAKGFTTLSIYDFAHEWSTAYAVTFELWYTK